MTIPYGRQSISQGDIDAVVSVMTTDWLTMGPVVTAFEDAIATLSGTPDSTVVSSGTAALHCAYAALNVSNGDEVITSPLTFVATAATAMALGVKVHFADVAADTGNIDPGSVAALITPRTKVIAGVDYAGHPVDADELASLAHSTGAYFLEDAAHSIASTYKNRPVGSLADITAFSFFPTKNMTTAEGGAVVSPDAALVERARRFRSHGLVRNKEEQRYPDEGPWHQEVHEIGLNYRLPDVLSALGLNQVKRIAEFKARRTSIFERYKEELSDVAGLILPTKRDYVDPMWHLYPVRIPEGRRREVFDFMRNAGVLVQVNYLPAYWHPVFEDLGYKRGMCPVAEAYYEQEISLPMYADLSHDQQSIVIDVLRKALA
ncbi:UDP-4-amino-4,6-dideoxy-N-acetyl-beta-L-altrosami ne transaminase [Alpinimonas psychrophila]|uniref:dTDP-4-amino-4,6-dideoxygalactose transaminase n=1 Tax=Alpinimonas psychrophila TaxID=748908 RepID=A0A7W3JUD8_9MICO|nr:aminotransferase class V-fold PLP-dependent enzyme [Alpinimonas psychrophila]MBA8829267.1 dTDP-4-amino-4,6-dideoxygalactose transaminase [Alpinimonas psychrophila]